MAEHCWHMRSLGVTGSKTSAETRRCCNCGQSQNRALKAVKDTSHGPHVKDVWTHEQIDADEVMPCKPVPVAAKVGK